MAPRKPGGQHLQLEDLILPTELTQKRFGEDFVLLAHYAHGNIEAIRSEGLKSLAQLASEPNPTEEVKKYYAYRSTHRMFGNDPTLIYFRPLEPSTRGSRLQDCLIVAAHPDSVNIFDQEYRAVVDWNKSRSYQENMYKSSSLNILEFFQRLRSLNNGQCLNQFGRPVELS